MLQLKERDKQTVHPGVKKACGLLNAAKQAAKEYQDAIKAAAEAWEKCEAAVGAATVALQGTNVNWPQYILAFSARVEAGHRQLHKYGAPVKMPGFGRIDLRHQNDFDNIQPYGEWFAQEADYVKKQIVGDE